uniref:Putative tick salivary metalloprotease n=1 Tax=Rhipicephalus pulchellus TaxID=72859 RepID=L7LRN0_RHIPC
MSLAVLISAQTCSSFVIIALQILYTLKCASISHQEQIVFPELIEERDDGAAKVLKINEDLTLNLEKSSVLAEEFLLRTYDGPVMQHSYLDGEVLEKDLYHDTRYLSSLMVSQGNGLQVEGVLGPMLGIKPLMANARTEKGRIAHVLFEIPPEMERGNEGVFTHASFNISERQEKQDNAKIVIRPEIIVAADSAFYRQFNDHLKLLRYMTISMNSVNIRYWTIKNPRVQLRLCALEVFSEHEETFLYKVDKYVASGMSIQRIKEHVQHYHQRYTDYDAVYFVTGLDIARFKGYSWDTLQQGLAYVGGACTPQKVALGEDKAHTYKGVRIFAHEMGHLLGCPHDGEKHKQFTSESCPWNHGFIMSYIEHNSNSLKFSTCCNNMIHQHVNSVEGRCLLIQNTRRKIKKTNFTRDLAGDHIGRDEYCKLTFPEYLGTYVLPDNDIGRCHVCCYMPDDITPLGYKKAFLPDNSRCNESGGTVCINGDCVSERPKYVQYQPTK